MLRKFSLIPAILAAGLLLTTGSAIYAHGGGGGHGGGGHGGGGHGGGGHGGGHGGYGHGGYGHGGYGHGGYGGYGGLGYGGLGYGGLGYSGLGYSGFGLGYGGLRYYGGGYGGYGSGYGGGYGGGSGYYGGNGYYGSSGYAPSYGYSAPVYQNNSLNYGQAPNLGQIDPNANNNASSVRVLLPSSQATVLFDGQKTSSTGTDRLYHTPPLTPGVSHQYTIHATWTVNGREVSQDRVVTVTPGQTAVVDFTLPAPSEGVPLPK